MDISPNTSNLPYQTLRTDDFVLDLRAYVVKTDGEVPHTTTPTSITSNVVLSKVENERNVHKSRAHVWTASPVTVSDKYLGTAWGELQRFASAWTVTKTLVATATTTANGLLVGSSQALEHNPANWLRDTIDVTSWETRTSYVWDEELGVQLTQVESVVAHGTAVPASTIGKFYVQRQVDLPRDILTETTIGDGTTRWERTYYKTMQYTYPTLLAAWDGDEGTPASSHITVPNWNPGEGWMSSSFEETNARTIFQLQIHVREAFTEGARVRIHELLLTADEHTTLLAASENTAGFGTGADLGVTATTRARIFTPRPRDIVYDGLMFSLHVPNVLCDGDTISVTANGDDTYYGSSAVDGFTYYPSNITASAYIALIGSTVCVEDTCSPWKGGMYMRRRVYIVVK